MQSKPQMLVTGATGKTGAPVVQQLLEKGYPVRALVHREDARSARLRELGAAVVRGDLLDLSSVRSAIAGAKRAYFCYPPLPGLLEATGNVAVAARDEGLEAVVNMSQISAREGAGSHLARQHWLAERVFDWAVVGAIHVNPTFFAEDLYLFTGDSIAKEGKIYLPFGQGRHAPVSAEDIARVVTGVLQDPEPYIGARLVLTGSKAMTVTQMASVLSRELGRTIEYVDIPLETWREAMISRSGFPEFLADHLSNVAVDHQNGIFDAETDIVERIGGQKPQSLAEFVRAHRERFDAVAVGTV